MRFYIWRKTTIFLESDPKSEDSIVCLRGFKKKFSVKRVLRSVKGFFCWLKDKLTLEVKIVVKHGENGKISDYLKLAERIEFK